MCLWGLFGPGKLRQNFAACLSVHLSICPSVHPSVCLQAPSPSPGLRLQQDFDERARVTDGSVVAGTGLQERAYLARRAWQEARLLLPGSPRIGWNELGHGGCPQGS